MEQNSDNHTVKQNKNVHVVVPLDLCKLFGVCPLQDLQSAHANYCKQTSLLIKWIKFTIVNLDNREFPSQLYMVEVHIVCFVKLEQAII